MLIAPAFLPKAVGEWSGKARELAISLLDDLYPKGECEFVNDFAMQLPIIIFLKMCDLPLDDREQLLEWVQAGVRADGDIEYKTEMRRQQGAYITRLIEERKANPGDDLVSQMVHSKINGEPTAEDKVYGLVYPCLMADSIQLLQQWDGWLSFLLEARTP